MVGLVCASEGVEWRVEIVLFAASCSVDRPLAGGMKYLWRNPEGREVLVFGR